MAAPDRPKKQTLRPVRFTWTGDAMQPVEAAKPICAQFVPGQRYALVPYDERSHKTHDHYFACVHKAWQNWPEDYPRHLTSADQMRKHALIATGHYDQSVVACESNEAAAAFVRDIMRSVDYAEGSIAGTVVVLRLAKTQKKNVMGAAAFQQSKEDVLNFLSSVLAVDVTTLAKEAMRGAA
jgi:hypothetical protein